MFIAHKHTRIVKFMAVFIALIAVGVGGWVYFQPTTNAANLKNFDPGNIISDSVMSNKNSMSVAQIQSFLDSKNACNNTNTYMAGWYPNLKYTIKNGKFVCMAQDTFNGKSAAQIIWQVGQDYSINPQALLVLLEKEQGLVSDTWPNNTQYNTATGFGCPDTAACDSKYFGLENQLRQAASLFRTVMDGGWTNYPVGSTYVQYNPNAACGGTVVNIQNRATSALYRYTPYQPNQSALNAGYGTGDGCGAYGNRNFWLFFTDWFGSTQGDRWTSLADPRVLVTTKSTHKINPDTKEKIQSLNAGLEMLFPTKTNLADNTGCLRTLTDTKTNVNACIPYSDLGEFDPIYNNLATDGSISNKRIAQWTCKVNYRSVQAVDQCFPEGTDLELSKRISVAGTEYYVTQRDYVSGSTTAFRADRIIDIPWQTTTTTLDKDMLTQKNTQWTCKVDLDLLIATNKCFDTNTEINFSKSVVINNTKYLITQHDENNNLSTGFKAERFTKV